LALVVVGELGHEGPPLVAAAGVVACGACHLRGASAGGGAAACAVGAAGMGGRGMEGLIVAGTWDFWD
jgi:hypothetical protein